MATVDVNRTRHVLPRLSTVVPLSYQFLFPRFPSSFMILGRTQNTINRVIAAVPPMWWRLLKRGLVEINP